MNDNCISTLFRGCKNCPNAPQTFEEYCLSKCCPEKICPDAYTEVAYHCGNYEHTATEERELNELGLIPRYKGHWIKDYDNSALDGLYHCSVCGRKLWISKEESFSDYPYCHCGAEMKGEASNIE